MKGPGFDSHLEQPFFSMSEKLLFFPTVHYIESLFAEYIFYYCRKKKASASDKFQQISRPMLGTLHTNI